MNLKRNNIDLDNKLIIAETVKNLKNGVSKSLAMNTLKRAKQYCNSKQILITEMLPTDIDNLSMNSQDKKVLNTALSISFGLGEQL